MARDPLKPYRNAGAALVDEVQQRLGEVRQQGKSAAEHLVVATKADLARLEARVEALERATRAARKTGAAKSGAGKAGAGQAVAKKASTPRSSR